MKTEELGEILNIGMSAGATAVAELVDKEVKISVDKVEAVQAGTVSLSEFEPSICFEYTFTSGLSDKSVVVMKSTDVALLVGTLLQKEFTEGFELDEVNKTAAAQIAGDLLKNAFKSISNFANVDVDISEAEPFMAPETDTLIKEYYNADQEVSVVRLNLLINGVSDTAFSIIFDEAQTETLIGSFNKGVATTTPTESDDESGENSSEYVDDEPSYDIRPVELQRYGDEASENGEQSSNLNMIMNVPLQITVEIGRTKKQIKDILELTTGSIIELNKQAGSHVDVFVNGQPIASGEVVVVDDYYGVRISEILNTGEIMKIL